MDKDIVWARNGGCMFNLKEMTEETAVCLEMRNEIDSDK